MRYEVHAVEEMDGAVIQSGKMNEGGEGILLSVGLCDGEIF